MTPKLRKLLLFLALVTCMSMLGLVKLYGIQSPRHSFTPPDKAGQKDAVGDTADVSVDLQAAFDSADKSFSAIPSPGSTDWLSVVAETGQTFAQYRRSNPNLPDKDRSTIYLQPLGDFPSDITPDLDRLEDFASVFFDMPVKHLPKVEIEGLPVESRQRQSGRQVLAGDVLKWMKPRVPADAYCLLAVTMTDLYPDPKWNFVFGQGSFKDRVGVYSFARYLPDSAGTTHATEVQQLMLLRSCKVLAHETGHMFGMKHCVHYHCLMNGSNGLRETDAAPIHLCPVCLRKLHFAKPFDVRLRYQKLETISDQFGWSSEASWIRQRIQTIQ